MPADSPLHRLSSTDRFFAENLLAMRQGAELSQEGLAEKMREQGFPKYSQMTVSRIEKGQRTVGLTEARALAAVLQTSTEQMASPPESVKAITEILEAHRYLRNSISSITAGMHDAIFALSVAEQSLSETEGVPLDEHLPPDIRARVQHAQNYIRGLKGGGLNIIMFEAQRELDWRYSQESPDASSP